MRPFVAEPPPGAVICDVRWTPSGGPDRAGYEAGHLSGAVFVDLDRDLAAPATAADGRHPLPEPEAFAAAMGRLGIGDGDVAIAYDGLGGIVAARLVWMLRALGEDAALLDGGLGAVTGPLETGPGHDPAPARFTPRSWPPGTVAGLNETAAEAAAGYPVLDARAAERFRGDGPPNPLDPRPGHVPGARSLPAAGHLDGDGRLLPEGTLRERFAAAGGDAGAFIAMCGSGVTACHTLLVAEQLGLGPGRLYPGSWSQYAADPGRVAATGPD